MPPALPNELILEIFSLAVPMVRRWTIGEHPDDLGSRRDLLRSLSLVYRDFTPWAQRELFAYLRVTAPDSTKAFATREKRLRGIKAKGGKVRGLDVLIPSTLGEGQARGNEQVDILRTLLRILAREDVEELRLQFDGEVAGLPFDFPSLRRLTLLSGARNGDSSWISSLPSNLARLRLEGIGFSDLPSPLPHLTSLVADRVSLWELDDPADFLPLFPSLKSLVSIHCSDLISLDVLERAPSTLEHLVVVPHDYGDVNPNFLSVQSLPHPPKTLTFVVPHRAILDDDVKEELGQWCKEKEVRGRVVRVDEVGDFDLDSWQAAL